LSKVVARASLPSGDQRDHEKFRREERAMTEQPHVPEQPDSEDEPRAEGAGERGQRPGTVRTSGETAVDDAIGTGDNVH
jgi:hypothetical protein